MTPDLAPDANGGPKVVPFVFTGRTADYYSVYYTNLLLSLVTLGIYSAWAKVRNRRWFLGHTQLMGHIFDFDAKPVAILVSRIMVIVLVVGAGALDEHYGLNWLGLGYLSGVLLMLLPLAIVRGRSFYARHTFHRGVRFNYKHIYWPQFRVFVIFLLPPALVSVTLLSQFEGLDWSYQGYVMLGIFAYLVVLFPAYSFMNHSIQVNQAGFGRLGMRYQTDLRTYYGQFLRSVFYALGVYVVAIVAFAAFSKYRYDPDLPLWEIVAISASVTFLVPLYVLYNLYAARMAHIYFSSLAFDDGSRLSSTIRPVELFLRIIVVNHILIIMSIGILLPWARVRRWRYIAERIQLVPTTDTLNVLAAEDAELSPLASEFVDVEGFDFDFGTI